MANLFQSASHVSISGGTFTVIDSRTPAAASSVHDKLTAATAPNALPDSAARSDVSRCHPGTRSKVQDFCRRWAQGSTHEWISVLWLLGGAGAGKSAIMQTVADWCASQHLSLAGFFFSRTDPTRNTADVLIPTLAYQLTTLYPSVNAVINPIIEQDPLIFKRSLTTQLACLLIQPLQFLVKSGIIGTEPGLPTIFLIDALDECNDSRKQELIIRMVQVVLYDHGIPVKFLISSRPEYTISNAFEPFQRRHQSLFTISLSDAVDAEADIRRFIMDKFSKIREEHPFRMMIPSGWPSVGDTKTLVAKSSSHFIYASTVMKYIASTGETPVRSLQVVLGLQTSRNGSPFADLDALYHHILGSAVHLQNVLQILALCIFSSLPPYMTTFHCMLGYDDDDVKVFLFDMAALVRVGDLGFDNGVELLHASLGDFLTDRSRSQDLYIDESTYHGPSVVRCFTLLGIFGQHGISTGYYWHTYEYSALTDQILHSITKLGRTVDARDILSEYNLQAFHDLVVRFEPEVDIDRPSKCVLNYVEAVRLADFNDGGDMYRIVLEQFFDILLFYLEKEMQTMAPAILPMIFSGYSTTAVRNIIFHYGLDKRRTPYLRETTSYLLTCDTTFRSIGQVVHSVFDNLNLPSMGTSRHSANASPETMAVAAQVLLEYASQHRPRAPFSKAVFLQTPHKHWLQRRKPGKRVAMGSPKLASTFHRRCRRYQLKDKQLPYSYTSEKLQNYLGLLPETYWHVPQRDICFVLVLKAILWVLPKAAHRDELSAYTGMTFPRAVYQRCPKLARRVLTCLSMYDANVREAKL